MSIDLPLTVIILGGGVRLVMESIHSSFHILLYYYNSVLTGLYSWVIYIIKSIYTMKKLILFKSGNLNNVLLNYHTMGLIFIVLNIFFSFTFPSSQPLP